MMNPVRNNTVRSLEKNRLMMALNEEADMLRACENARQHVL